MTKTVFNFSVFTDFSRLLIKLKGKLKINILNIQLEPKLYKKHYLHTKKDKNKYTSL